MQSHQGRLIDHVHLRARDLAAAKSFYQAVLTAIGRADAIRETDTYFSADELWIDAADEAGSSRVHLAFQARDRDTVARFHGAAIAAPPTTARRASAATTQVTMRPTCSIRTATVSRLSIMVQPIAPRILS